MNVLESSLKRIEAVFQTIKVLRDSEFPYSDCETALLEVENIFLQTRDQIHRAHNSHDQDAIVQASENALTRLFVYIPLLGFILRSTNVRNAFEVHGPLLSLSKRLLGDNVKLLLSSEWEYSPMTYLGVPKMQNFVFIGFPATESSNPFLLPLAGHELGHSIWLQRGLERKVDGYVTQIIQNEIQENRWEQFKRLYKIKDLEAEKFWGDLFHKQHIGPATAWATRQTEETFCDLVGLRLFGASFLHAFVYLLAPGQQSRYVLYPSSRTRISNLLMAASKWGIDTPQEYQSVFRKESSEFIEKDSFQLELAEFAVTKLVDDLIVLVNNLVNQSGLKLPDKDSVQSMVKRIHLTVPVEHAESLPAIIEAGWESIHDVNLWQQLTHINQTSKQEYLSEIILKSIESLEIKTRVSS